METHLSTAESRPNDSIAGPVAIVIFGASGDLTRRKLVPALHSLGCGDLLPADLHVLPTDQPLRLEGVTLTFSSWGGVFQVRSHHRV